jgi:hypothetical protein
METAELNLPPSVPGTSLAHGSEAVAWREKKTFSPQRKHNLNFHSAQRHKTCLMQRHRVYAIGA